MTQSAKSPFNVFEFRSPLRPGTGLSPGVKAAIGPKRTLKKQATILPVVNIGS